MSRKLDDLLPEIEAKARFFLNRLTEEGIAVIVTSTYRSAEEQNALYAQGRTTPGKIVTNARAGQSWHNHRRALDLVPLRNGKPVWGTQGADAALWEKIGKIGEECGFEWAGRWRRFREFPHFQITNGLSLKDMGKT